LFYSAIVVFSKYEEASDFSEGLARIKLNGKWGYIDKTGKEIIPLKYEALNELENGFMGAELNKKWKGYMDKKGTQYWQD